MGNSEAQAAGMGQGSSWLMRKGHGEQDLSLSGKKISRGQIGRPKRTAEVSEEWQSGWVRLRAGCPVGGMAPMCGKRLPRPDRCRGPSQVDWRSGWDVSSKQGA